MFSRRPAHVSGKEWCCEACRAAAANRVANQRAGGFVERVTSSATPGSTDATPASPAPHLGDPASGDR